MWGQIVAERCGHDTSGPQGRQYKGMFFRLCLLEKGLKHVALHIPYETVEWDEEQELLEQLRQASQPASTREFLVPERRGLRIWKILWPLLIFLLGMAAYYALSTYCRS